MIRSREIYLLGLISIFLATASLADPLGIIGSEVVISANAGLDISSEKLNIFKNDALSGSGAAAHKLASFYYFVKRDRAMGLYWETIAAEDGNPMAMASLGFHMAVEEKGHQTDLRARFWLERAKAAGESTAKVELDALDRDGR